MTEFCSSSCTALKMKWLHLRTHAVDSVPSVLRVANADHMQTGKCRKCNAAAFRVLVKRADLRNLFHSCLIDRH